MRFVKNNAIALTALVFAMTGTGVAASRYLITSTSQIKPSVLREIRRGPRASSAVLTVGGAPAVAARARSVGAVATSTTVGHGTLSPEPGETADPLSGATWTQHAEEVEQLVGTVKMTSTTEAQCYRGPENAFGGGTGGAMIYLDGNWAGFALGPIAEASPQTVTEPITWVIPRQALELLYEPGKSTKHTLTATAWDSCGREGGKATAHFTIDAISVDVMGFR